MGKYRALIIPAAMVHEGTVSTRPISVRKRQKSGDFVGQDRGTEAEQARRIEAAAEKRARKLKQSTPYRID